jgi:hypothetical protein
MDSTVNARPRSPPFPCPDARLDRIGSVTTGKIVHIEYFFMRDNVYLPQNFDIVSDRAGLHF